MWKIYNLGSRYCTEYEVYDSYFPEDKSRVIISKIDDWNNKIECSWDFFYRYRLFCNHVLWLINFIQLKSLEGIYDLMKRWRRPESDSLWILNQKIHHEKYKDKIDEESLEKIMKYLTRKSNHYRKRLEYRK